MSIEVLGSSPIISGTTTGSGAPIEGVAVPGWDVPTGVGVYMGTPVEDGYVDIYADTYGGAQLLSGSMTLRNAAGQPTGLQMALHVTTPAIPSYDKVIVPTDLGATSVVGIDGFSGGADISDLIPFDLGDGVARVAGVAFYDYHGWEIATYGRFPAYLVFERDPVTLEWSYDAARSKTVDELHASADPSFADDLFEERTNTFAENYRFGPGMNELAACPVSGHLLATCYYPSTSTNSGSVIAIDPATSEVVAYLRLPDFVHPTTGHDVQWAPREIQTDPSGTLATRAVVLADCADLDDGGAQLPHTMLEVSYDGSTLTQESAPCLPPEDDTDYACAGWSPDGVLYAATHYVATTLAGLASKPLNVFRVGDALPGTGEDYGTQASPSYTVASMAGAGATPFVLEQDPTTGTVITVGAFGGRCRSWQPASPDVDTATLALNPTFAADVDDWSGRLLTCGVSWDAGDGGRLLATGNGNASTMSARQTSQTLPVDAAGRSMICSATVRAGVSGSRARVGIDFLTATGTLRYARFGSWRDTSTGSTTDLYGDCVVPVGVTDYRVFVEWDTNAAGDTHYVLTNDIRFAPGTEYPEVNISTHLFVSGQSNVRRGGFVGDALAVVVQPYSTTHDYPAAPYDLSSYVVTVPISYMLGLAPDGREGLSVEIGFGATWETEPVDIAWTDVTGRTLEADWVDGKQADLAEFPPGEATIVLENSDRVFDPEHTGGIYYGELLPRVPFRLQGHHDGETYDLFYGFVEDGWEQTLSPPAAATCTVNLVDLLAVLEGYTLPSVLEVEILADSPLAYWKLDETSGLQMVDSSGHGRDGEYTHGTTSLAMEGESADGGIAPGIKFDGEHGGAVTDASAAVTERPCVIEALVAPTSDISGGQTVYNGGSGNPTFQTGFVTAVPTETTWAFAGQVFDDSADNYAVTATDLHRTDAFHHVAFRAPAVGATKVYLDGADATDDNFTLDTNAALSPGSTVGAGKTAAGTPTSGHHGFIAHVAVFDSDIGATRIAAHADAAVAPLGGLGSDEQIAWALDQIGVPADLRDLDAGVAVMGSADTGGRDALEFMREVTATEQGDLYVAHHDGGKIRFRNRYASFVDTRSLVAQATISDDPAEDEGDVARVDPGTLVVEPNGVASVVRQATVSWRGGQEVIAGAATYGRSESITTTAPTAAVARGIGQWITAKNAAPTTRVRSAGIDPGADGTDFPTALGTHIGDRVEYRSHPQEVGDPVTKTLEVLGRRHVVHGLAWRTTFYMTPAPAVGVDLFTLGTSELGGTHILAY